MYVGRSFVVLKSVRNVCSIHEKNECVLGVQTDNEEYYSGTHNSNLVLLNKNSPDLDTTSVSSLKTYSETLRPHRRDLVLVEKPLQQKAKPKKESKRLVWEN